MRKVQILVLSVLLVSYIAPFTAAADDKQKSSVRMQEIVGKIIQVDLQNSTIELEYEFDDQTHQTKSDMFYVTDATTIDVATVKSSLKDLKAGSDILVEFAQMPDGAKVVESVWVKKS